MKQTNKLLRVVESHLTGEHHSQMHKFIFGMLIMCFGVSLVKATVLSGSGLINFCGETLGYCIHGIGSLPVIKAFEKKEML